MKESASASHIRLAAAQHYIELWRNNVGVLINDRGVPVRYGLANDSAGLNERVKSSDLIGITPVYIKPEMIGSILGVFTAVETKASDWKRQPSDERANAQAAFHDIVLRAGGFAGFATCVEDFWKIIKK